MRCAARTLPSVVSVKSSTDGRARLILANLVNELMIARPVLAHAAALFTCTSRKLWLARDGDMVVMPRQPSPAFVRYVCELLRVDAASIQLVSTDGGPTGLLAHEVQASKWLTEQIRDFCRSRGDVELLCYALDAPTARLALSLGIRPEGYEDAVPNSEVLPMIYNLNTKSGFRAVASRLGLPIAEGSSCNDVHGLRRTVFDLLARHGKARMKLDRSSNGYGQSSVTASGRDAVGRAIEEHLATCDGQPVRFVVEQELRVAESPSIECVVGHGGATTTYICVQRYREGQFSGMVADTSILDHDIVDRMTDAGEAVGRYLSERGYRGVFDLDAIVTDRGELYFTETNVRRTAGTFIHELVSHLTGTDGAGARVWIADRAAAPGAATFQSGAGAIRSHGLAYCAASRTGVILTSDGVENDRTWRFVIVAENRRQAEEMEKELGSVLVPSGKRE